MKNLLFTKVRKCKIEGCEQQPYSSGMCRSHFYKYRKYGSPFAPDQVNRKVGAKDFPREYCSWTAMKQRCYNSKTPGYENWGGRGIRVCDRWLEKPLGFQNFLEDMGTRPEGTSLDRIDNNKDYGPDNCRWANQSLQVYNQRPREHSTKSIGVTVEHRGNNTRYRGSIERGGKRERADFNNFMDALIWRAEKERELFSDESLQADKKIALIIKWGRDHGITDANKQYLKVVEEVAEIARELARGNYEGDAVIDALGDSFVTLIILCDILGMNPVDTIEEAWDEIKDRKGRNIDGVFVKEEDLKEQ